MANQIGLNSKEAKELLEKYGRNELVELNKVSPFILFLHQFKSPLVFALLLVAGVTLIIHEYSDTIVISAVIVFNSIVGFFQERKAQNAVNSLKQLISPKSKVYRDGELKVIDAAELVPGDVVVVESGDRVPADGKLLEFKNMQVNEAQLTGESFPVEKSPENLAMFMGTIVTNGNGQVVVEKTGMSTEIGNITKLVSNKNKDETPLEVKFKKLTHKIIFLVLIACALVFLVGFLKGYSLDELFRTSISLGVSTIPEGLPVVVTLTLAIGVYRMSRKNAVVKNLPSASTLAGVDVICTDKTGTITEGKVELESILVANDSEIVQHNHSVEILKHAVLCNNATLSGENEFGDLLDLAILKFAYKNNIPADEFRETHKRLDELPFDSQYKYQATLNLWEQNQKILIIKGAFEVVLEKCKFEDHKLKEKILERINLLTSEGLRVIILASKIIDKDNLKHEDIHNLSFNAVLVFLDPLRLDVKDALKDCAASGIKTIMITGDHVSTAKTIAHKAGIHNEKHGIVMEGEVFRNLSIDDLSIKIERLDVIARANPLDKTKLIDILKNQNKIVAMTGDGINDAPALVNADIGIAMGKGGTDAAIESSDMVLLDNKFSTIVKGIEQARVVFENLRKVVTYLMSTSFGEVLTIFMSVIIGLPLPIVAAQVLWLNLITDGLLDVAIATEGKHKNIMQYEPSRYHDEIVNKIVLLRIAIVGVIMAIGSIIFFQMNLHGNSLAYAQTCTLIVLAMFQWFNALNSRSEDESIFRIGVFTNKYVILAIITQVFLCLAAVYVPFMQRILNTESVKPDVWLYALMFSITIIFFEEIRKAWFRSMKIR